MVEIKDEQLRMYDITEKYKNYLRKFDKRVSQKESRRFYGIIVTTNNMDYYIPFTSKINKKINFEVFSNPKDNRYQFFKEICCDFALLESKCKQWCEKN